MSFICPSSVFIVVLDRGYDPVIYTILFKDIIIMAIDLFLCETWKSFKIWKIVDAEK